MKVYDKRPLRLAERIDKWPVKDAMEEEQDTLNTFQISQTMDINMTSHENDAGKDLQDFQMKQDNASMPKGDIQLLNRVS